MPKKSAELNPLFTILQKIQLPVSNFISNSGYLKNSKLSEARVLFAKFRTKIMSIYSDKGSWPTFEELKNAGVMLSGTDVESAVYNRDIPSICYTIQGFDAATGNKIGWNYQNQGTITAPKIMWGCKEADNPSCVKYVPARYLKCWCDV